MATRQSGGRLRSLDVCAGAGGLALGLEQAGFDPVMLIENDQTACETLVRNRPGWDVRNIDLLEFDPAEHKQVYDVDLLSAGLPRVKATATVSRSRGSEIELKLLQAVVMLMHGVHPRALIIENVPDLVTKEKYREARDLVETELAHLGYRWQWLVVNAADFGVPQDRKQGVLVGFKDSHSGELKLKPRATSRVTVGQMLETSMAAHGWRQAHEWARQADTIAPTIVGGSKDRGGADLGPTGSKRAWERMGVNGASLADAVPGPDFPWDPSRGRTGMVRLTVGQVGLLQGFPGDWEVMGRKTARYGQVAQASPPPVARAIGEAIMTVLKRR